ncbi:ribbon-helix-helix domain-containing protein [Novosphingobium guangzhouense]|uniref:Aryl-sulfate sulfotransferase n=1 Tax=Novosphingobium guangzhouense TaxID=1850347 RepID=A0A2K2FSL0_9SPHN|nr:ribbon-helix-helix domain-containing protein [Novosphingobium guangzhouense]PNU01750.1 aryl-sulfate sulfotransferase [Novosphingobium guangzhouense]
MPTPYHPPVKRSVEIAGHKTSISLEPVFWELLKQAATREGVPVNALVARIDAERLEAETPPGLAGAVRVWLATSALARRSRDGDHGMAITRPG